MTSEKVASLVKLFIKTMLTYIPITVGVKLIVFCSTNRGS